MRGRGTKSVNSFVETEISHKMKRTKKGHQKSHPTGSPQDCSAVTAASEVQKTAHLLQEWKGKGSGACLPPSPTCATDRHKGQGCSSKCLGF